MIVDERYKVDGYFPTIGIECHVQLKTKSKLFGTESNDAREAKPNTLIGHVSYGLPGALPVLNEEAIRLASKAAFALGAKPQKFSKFDRKHYFYPDLPNGYQITQFDEPIILGGRVEIILDDGTPKTINITRAHLEADAGKSTHPAGADYSLVDLNRAGTPLLEIVSEPEMHNGAEAKAYAKELWIRMKFADVSDADLYHGNMRFDVNVSVSKDPTVLGTRSETKNLNSFKSVERAVEYEIDRQIGILEKGETVVQETRGWLDDKQKTVSQRSKEDAHDYRYFPDPDIPPVLIDDDYINEVEKTVPIMPNQWRQRLEKSGIDSNTIEDLLFAEVSDESVDYLSLLDGKTDEFIKRYSNWVVNVFVPLQNDKGSLVTKDSRILHSVSAVIELLDSNKLNSNTAKSLLTDLVQMPELPVDVEDYAESKGYIQISDSGAIEQIVEQVLSDNPKPSEDVKNGEMKAIGFLVGQVMKSSKGKANPEEAQKIIREKLGV